MKLTLVMLFLAVFTVPCMSQQRSTVANRKAKRDSLFIAYTVFKWTQTQKVSWFERSRYYCKDSTKRPVVIVDTILYSPDKLKMYSIVIIARDTCTIRPHDREHFYDDLTGSKIFDGRGVIGFREDSNQMWKLYHYSPLIQQGFRDIKELSTSTREFFFSEFKNRGDKAKQEHGEMVVETFKYNINDPDFWTKSFVWRKGLALPGYYNFQLKGIVMDEVPKPLEEVPVTYPDSLRRLFKK